MANIDDEQSKSIIIDGVEVPYTVKYKDGLKNIILKVKQDKIFVSCPRYVKQHQIDQMIIDNYPMLIKEMSKYDSAIKKYDLVSLHPWIMIFDKKVPVTIVDENVNIKMTDDGIVMKNYYDNDLQLKKLYSFIAKYYRNYLMSRVLYYAGLMNLSFESMTIKNMSSKWGACYTREQQLIFNTKLLHFSEREIDSVVVHELAHLVYPNHSKEFWELVYKYFPEYKKSKKILDANGII